MLLALQDRDSLALREGVQFFDPRRMKRALGQIRLDLGQSLGQRTLG